ncbi:YkgJ family cysteine cluster protein [Pseudodesulfovibrio sp.]|uniref:YkgJ family cysteine cluster protein n=1 Tax=Pseudodesulfovibrio sp. TaxID=2035812 RepID=UPI0026184B16|nr:YkgJ family cysteine cluster protein [Pseudodesulfovibrio sp.]MDD3313229.1 YkgJ family cysteine cluster protein [Pseudodesulfovibrio sp.]
MTSNPRRTFILDFDGESPLRLDCELPAMARSPLDILPAVFALADAIHTRSAAALGRMGRTVSCGPGCPACCNQLVPVSAWEALHLAAVIRSMEPPRRHRVVRRFARGVERLNDAGLLAALERGFRRHTLEPRVLAGLQRAYWNLRIPCPFLEANACSIHPHRPLACRAYMVTSAPARCAALYGAEQSHEIVLHAADPASTLAAFSGVGITRTRVLPLLLSLSAAPSLRPEPAPLPGDRMFARFLDLMAASFVRRV